MIGGGGSKTIAKTSPVRGLSPAVLRWARESANMTTADVAGRIKKTAELIEG
jgi:hypothetical protein